MRSIAMPGNDGVGVSLKHHEEKSLDRQTVVT
jgi:hypothetical protein